MKNLNFLTGLFLSFFLLSVVTNSLAALVDPLTTIELDTPVHFLTPDGSDLRVEAGTYTIEPAEEWIRLMSGERHNAVLIEANKGTHELELEQTMALSVSGESEEEKDNHHVMLLLPNGQSLEATGTYSGIRARGGFQKAFNRVKKKANNSYKKARSTAKKATSQAKTTAQRAKKQVQQSVKKGTTQAKKSVQNARKFIQKSGRKAATQARKGSQSARNAALHTKRQIEKNTRRMGSNLKSGIQKGLKAVTGGSGKWGAWSRAANMAARKEALGWIGQAYVDRNLCKIFAKTVVGTPGVLKSRYSFKGEIRKALIAAGAPKASAEGWDKAFKESWDRWAKNVMIPGLPFYPAFTAYPGPQAPPMPNVPVPLTTLPSAGMAAMTPDKMTKTVQSRIGSSAKSQEATFAISAFANDISRRFLMCMSGCQLMNVMGSGPVPSFAPPYIPVGPVINGSCSGGNIPTALGFNDTAQLVR